MADLKFPGRAFFLAGAFFLCPAILVFAVAVGALVDDEKIELSFDMDWNGTPSLLIALHCFQRDTEELGQ